MQYSLKRASIVVRGHACFVCINGYISLRPSHSNSFVPLLSNFVRSLFTFISYSNSYMMERNDKLNTNFIRVAYIFHFCICCCETFHIEIKLNSQKPNMEFLRIKNFWNFLLFNHSFCKLVPYVPGILHSLPHFNFLLGKINFHSCAFDIFDTLASIFMVERKIYWMLPNVYGSPKTKCIWTRN